MKKCLICGNPLNVTLSLGFLLSIRPYRQPVVCRGCRDRFERLSADHQCKDCGQIGKFKNSLCDDCRRWRKLSGRRFKNHGLYRYNLMMSEFMHRYKFQGDYRLRKVFQDEFNTLIREQSGLVVPIPVHPDTYRRRGFNQVMGLIGDVKTVKALATRNDQKSVPQSHKTRVDRLKLVQPFKLVDNFRKRISGQRIVIADDVYTTGTTIHHAANLLYAAGARSIEGVTLAR